ncbi:phosphodiester glycosidase family protein [Roseovarius salinarum]|uniref:phosphodiester glycosidase family protein n=1 Tax=Roseovarius salinarum TaxID=1981892 RepID=UPI000C3490EA|nr:phosphodiester glycosidase family protein [Roseovarius salinarum]
MPGRADAVECRELTHADTGYTVCEVDATREDLRLFLDHPETGRRLGSFENLRALLAGQGAELAFAMNAGMYHPDRSPVGHYVEAGRQVKGVVRGAGPGNFGLLPNGVLCINDARVRVIETERYIAQAPGCRDATQSGPMLVIDGRLHPRFLKDSDSRYVRNGVGTSADGRRAVFAVSNRPVTFHAFGRLFRDVLQTPQALYLDGNISRLYAPELGRHDGGFPMGPIVGVVDRGGD